LEPLAIALIAFVAGGVLGTLVNVIATRLPSDLAIIGPPLQAGTGELSNRQLVPYLGSRLDNGKFDWPNLATQLGAGVLAALALVLHGFSFSALETTVLSVVLLTILRIDWQHHSIYVITIWPGIILALAFALVNSPTRLLSASVAGALAAFVFLLLFFLAIAIYRKRALGFGDVLLAGLIGTMVGLQWVTHAILLGMILAALGGIFLVLIRVKSRTDYIPYGAYLSLGAIVVVMASR
jgi:leader peptidase (prepilin peptidase) / N-methyltransferase